MKKTILFAVACLTMLVSCTEAPIEPSGNYSVLRMRFPQGNNDFDMELKKIHDKYDVYVLYKEITLPDLNRKWTSLGTDYLYYGESVPDKYMPFYVEFLNNVLGKVSVEIAKNALPVKIYLLNNFRGIPSAFGTEEEVDPNMKDDALDGTVDEGISPYFRSNRLDGFDYWAFSFRPSEIEANDPQALKRRRLTIIYQFILKAWQDGIITQPENMMAGLNLEDPFAYDSQNPYAGSGKNHPLRRGFVYYIYPEFDPALNRGQFIYSNTYISYYDGNGRTVVRPEDNVYFLNFVKAAMCYSREDFFRRYPARNYPIIAEKYELVVSHMKEMYGIDLEDIAEGPNIDPDL